MAAIVAIINLLFAREPLFGFPDIALFLCRTDRCHPPIQGAKNRETDDPFDQNPDDVNDAKQKKPKATVLALDVTQLDLFASAFRTLSIN